MKGRIFSILLLSGFIIPLISNEALFRVESYLIHSQLTERLHIYPKDQVQTMTFTGEFGIVWQKIKKEFIFKGKLYDVVSIDHSQDQWIIKCIPDHKEDGLISAYLKSIDHGAGQNARILFTKSKLNLFAHRSPFLQFPEIVCRNFVLALMQSFPGQPIIQILSPPPEHF